MISEYDGQHDSLRQQAKTKKDNLCPNSCYGCALNCVVECLKLLRSMLMNKEDKSNITLDFLKPLLLNFHRGSSTWQLEVHFTDFIVIP